MSRIVRVPAVARWSAVVLSTSATLLPAIATHFGCGGDTDGFMSRAGCEMFWRALLVDAHTRAPRTLHEAAFVTAAGVFVILLLALVAAMYVRFRRPG